MNQKLEIGGLKSNYLGVKIENEIVDCVFNVVLVVNMVPSVTLAGNLLPPLLIASLLCRGNFRWIFEKDCKLFLWGVKNTKKKEQLDD